MNNQQITQIEILKYNKTALKLVVNEYAKTNSQLITALSTVLNYNFTDTEFVISQCNNFNVDFSHVWKDAQAMYDDNTIPTPNDLIYTIYKFALDNAIEEVLAIESSTFNWLATLKPHDFIPPEQEYFKEFAKFNINLAESSLIYKSTNIRDYQVLLIIIKATVNKLINEALKKH